MNIFFQNLFILSIQFNDYEKREVLKMKKYAIMIGILLLMPLVYAQEEGAVAEEEGAVVGEEEVVVGEEDAGAIGPEHGFLHAFDIVADNIKAFLSRIGGDETHANVVRKVVAERRAEHLRLLRLKQTGEISAEEFARGVSGLEKQIGKKEEALKKVEERIETKRAERARKWA